MNDTLIYLGSNVSVLARSLIMMLHPDSAPSPDLIQVAGDRGQLHNLTQGRPIRSIVMIDTVSLGKLPPRPMPCAVGMSPERWLNTWIYLSASYPETLSERWVIQRDRPFASLPSIQPVASMEIKLINIGFGNMVCANRIVAIVSPESAPIKRMVNDARERGQLVDATYGRRTRAVIVTDGGYIILSAIQPETVAHRFMNPKDEA